MYKETIESEENIRDHAASVFSIMIEIPTVFIRRHYVCRQSLCRQLFFRHLYLSGFVLSTF